MINSTTLDMLNDNQKKDLQERISEVEAISGSSVQLHYTLQENELFVEFIQNEKIVYRMMFKVRSEIGRPALGTTKKVSLTLTDREWEQLEELKDMSGSKSTSEVLRRLIRNVIGDSE